MAEVEESSNAEAKTAATEEKETENEGTAGMKPWEQHAGVISMPRFDYNAPSALRNHSYSGFFITCSIKREKSATKEAMSILEKYLGSYNSSESSESSKATNSSKRRKMHTAEIGNNCDQGMQNNNLNEDSGGLSKNDVPSLAKMVETVDTGVTLSLVKLTKSGLVLLIFPKEEHPDTVNTVSNIFQGVEAGTLKTPLWCHRIFPVQATCCLNEKELQAVVSKLVLQFMNGNQNKFAMPVKFAIGYNRRGLEETQVKSTKNASSDSGASSLLDRQKCFEVVASAIKDVVPDSAVDLKSPDLSVLVELLPLSGSNQSLVAAVSLLSQSLVSVKPRLCIRPLAQKAERDACDLKGTMRRRMEFLDFD